MVTKRSEYQNQFRSSVVRKHHAAYLENLNFRHERRDREFLHTPICWGEIVDEGNSSESSDDVDVAPAMTGEKVVQSEALQDQYQSLAEILEISKEKADAHNKQKLSEKDDVLDECPIFEKLSLDEKNENNNGKKLSKTAEENLIDHKKDVGDKRIYDIFDDENRALNEKIAKKYALLKSDKEVQKSESDVTIPSKIEDDSNLRKTIVVKKRSKGKRADCKNTRQKKAEQSKSCNDTCKPETKVPVVPLSARVRRPDRRPMSQASSYADRPPFIAYGSGDIEENLAVHRTHNVRAPSDVYRPALKAKLRREEDRKKYRAQKELTRLSKQELLDKLSSPRDEIDWRSEYQKQFYAYDTKEYERAASSRAVIPRATPIRAVHRGGCVVVVVD